MLQRITSAATASASSAAGGSTARSVASLHTPVASCSYTPLRAAAQRVSALPRSGFRQGYSGLVGAAGLARYSSALAGSSLLPTQSQAVWTNHDRCCLSTPSRTIYAPMSNLDIYWHSILARLHACNIFIAGNCQ